mmetsp:Transcript_9192/g.13094  ORF Transcript_9192/g.13094 Transcript_9192/m.13094 type:complete len:196 (+) Transcript_9192:39-626(+)
MKRKRLHHWYHDLLTMIGQMTIVTETYDAPIDFQTYPYLAKAVDLRSVLNQHSPLLTESVRERIKEMGGSHWPPEYNSHETIRRCLDKSIFQILIKFEGTSHLTCGQVFALHQYRLEDIYIGWKFANVLRLSANDDDGCHSKKVRKKRNKNVTGITVDHHMIHFIMPQKGGGHEPVGDRPIERNLLRFLESTQDD